MGVLVFIGRILLALLIVGVILCVLVIMKFMAWSHADSIHCNDIVDREMPTSSGGVCCPRCGSSVSIDISKAVDSEAEVFICPECRYRFRFTEK